MMVFSPIDMNAYDVAATKITYCKLFDHIMNDFLTRKDCTEMMASSNLKVDTIVTTAVQVVVPAGTGTGAGKGMGQVTATYMGETPHGGSQALSSLRKSEKEAGGQATSSVLSTALGQ